MILVSSFQVSLFCYSVIVDVGQQSSKSNFSLFLCVASSLLAWAQDFSDWLQDCLIQALISATTCISCILFNCTVGHQAPTAVNRPSGSGLSLQSWCNDVSSLPSDYCSELLSSQAHLFGSTFPTTFSTKFLAATQKICFLPAVVGSLDVSQSVIVRKC